MGWKGSKNPVRGVLYSNRKNKKIRLMPIRCHAILSFGLCPFWKYEFCDYRNRKTQKNSVYDYLMSWPGANSGSSVGRHLVSGWPLGVNSQLYMWVNYDIVMHSTYAHRRFSVWFGLVWSFAPRRTRLEHGDGADPGSLPTFPAKWTAHIATTCLIWTYMGMTFAFVGDLCLTICLNNWLFVFVTQRLFSRNNRNSRIGRAKTWAEWSKGRRSASIWLLTPSWSIIGRS